MTSAFNDIVPEQQPEKLIGDLQFTEGPVWHPDGYLLFSDIPANRIIKYSPDGTVETYLQPSRNTNGLTFDHDMRLVACEHTGRQVSRQGDDGQMETVVSHWDGKRLNSPNDLVVHSGGSVFFTDPPYGIQPEEAEIGFNGVYSVDSDGGITLLASDFGRPNGLAFSPDESVLYVDDTERRNVRAFNVNDDLSLSDDRVFIDMDTPEQGSPDGMKVDTSGNLYVTGAGGVWVISPDADHLGTIVLPELPANVGFGGDDYRTLFVTARTGLYSVRVSIPGIAPGG